MQKTYYRIKLTDAGNTLCETLTLLAAKSNGGANKVTLKQLEMVAHSKCIEYPYLNNDVSIAVINPHLLHIDRKVGDKWELALSIEEIEVLELDENTILETKKMEE